MAFSASGTAKTRKKVVPWLCGSNLAQKSEQELAACADSRDQWCCKGFRLRDRWAVKLSCLVLYMFCDLGHVEDDPPSLRTL